MLPCCHGDTTIGDNHSIVLVSPCVLTCIYLLLEGFLADTSILLCGNVDDLQTCHLSTGWVGPMGRLRYQAHLRPRHNTGYKAGYRGGMDKSHTEYNRTSGHWAFSQQISIRDNQKWSLIMPKCADGQPNEHYGLKPYSTLGGDHTSDSDLHFAAVRLLRARKHSLLRQTRASCTYN